MWVDVQTKSQLNEIFKQVVVGRDWKNHASDVFELYTKERSEVIKGLESIVLKIMVIPAAQHKSAYELISIFIKVYETLLGKAKSDPSPVFKLINEHIETAFKLTQRQENHYKNRAYQWL